MILGTKTNKKYEFIGETMNYHFITLNRIRRISDGFTGGWIESADNLSPYGECFVYNEAKVFDNAEVDGNAVVEDHAVVEVDIAKSNMMENHKDYKIYGLAQNNGSNLQDVHIFNSIDEFLWYAIQRNIFVENHRLLKFDSGNISDYEYNTFNQNIIYKGKQDNWSAYILSW